MDKIERLTNQAVASLEFYLSRSQEILALLATEDPVGIEEIMRKKTAAFHNFRAADALLRAEGRDVGEHPKIKKIFEEIKIVDIRLKKAFERSYKETKRRYAAMLKVKSKISQYHSGTSEQNALKLEV